MLRPPAPGPYKLIVMDPPWPEKGGGKIKRGADKHYAVYNLQDIIAAVYAFEDDDGNQYFNPDPEGCQVWIWTTMNKLPMALELVEELGLVYITQRVWVKADNLATPISKLLGYAAESKLFTKRMVERLERAVERGIWTLQRFGLGQYVRGAHEIVVLAQPASGEEELVYSMADDHEVALLCRSGRTRTHCRKIPSVIIAPKTPQHSEKPQVFYDDCLKIAAAGRALEMFARDTRPGFDVVGDEVGTDWRGKEK